MRIYQYIGEDKFLFLKILKDKQAPSIGDSDEPSKFIIPPENYWIFQWNNFITYSTIIYIILIPLLTSRSVSLIYKDQVILFVFDVVFVIDRTVDLFIGFNRPDGQPETKIINIIKENLTINFFLEIIMSFGPLMILNYDADGLFNSLEYLYFKIFRLKTLYEIDG